VAKPPIKLIAFDMFGTLVQNEVRHWKAHFDMLTKELGLSVDGTTLHTEWSEREVTFPKTRTNMADPAASPTFRTYEDAWAEAFRGAFQALGVRADDRLAARRCSEVLGRRVAFPDTTEILAKLDDRSFLHLVIAANGWVSSRRDAPLGRLYALRFGRWKPLGLLAHRLFRIGTRLQTGPPHIRSVVPASQGGAR